MIKEIIKVLKKPEPLPKVTGEIFYDFANRVMLAKVENGKVLDEKLFYACNSPEAARKLVKVLNDDLGI